MRTSSIVALALVSAACGDPVHPAAGRQPIESAASLASGLCALPDVSTPTKIVATPSELIVGSDDRRVYRFSGAGCELSTAGEPVSGGLEDADELGNLYGRFLPEYWITKRDVRGHLTPLAGITRSWGFAASPTGGTMLLESCGPNGVYAAQLDGHKVLDLGHGPLALTGDLVLWGAIFSGRLEKTTEAGSVTLGPSTADFGHGVEHPTALFRCGRRPCATFTSGVTVWNDDGSVFHSASNEALGLSTEERVLQLTGNQLGLYLVTSAGDERHVRFVSTSELAAGR